MGCSCSTYGSAGVASADAAQVLSVVEEGSDILQIKSPTPLEAKLEARAHSVDERVLTHSEFASNADLPSQASCFSHAPPIYSCPEPAAKEDPSMANTLADKHVIVDGLVEQPKTQGNAIPELMTQRQPVPEPLRVRSSINTTEQAALAAFVADILPGWQGVDRSVISIEDRSAEGEGSVYKVSAPSAKPADVALHVWSEDADDILRDRTGQAHRLFADHGLALPRLAHGDNWFLESWEGGGAPDFGGEAAFALLSDLACLVARMHSLPTDWFEDSRTRLCDRQPALGNVPRGSHAWSWSSRDYLLGDLSPDCLDFWLSGEAAATPSFAAPDSAAGRRVVTVHADCHPANMLLVAGGIKFIDFEWSCVMYAVQDLAFVMQTCCDNDLSKKRHFMGEYLRASSLCSKPESVDAAIFDAEVFLLATHCGGPLELWEAHEAPRHWLRLARRCDACVRDARMSALTKQKVVELGAFAYLRECIGKDFDSHGETVAALLADAVDVAGLRTFYDKLCQC